MIYCDLTLSVCTGRNLSVRADRSTEVVGRHTMPDASNYISVSVRGPPSFGLLWKQRAAQEHARPLPSGRHGSARAAALNTLQELLLPRLQTQSRTNSLQSIRFNLGLGLFFFSYFFLLFVCCQKPHTHHRVFAQIVNSKPNNEVLH